MSLLGKKIDMWGHLKGLHGSETVEWIELIGRDGTGGMSTDVFSDTPVEITAVIRPWESDMHSVGSEGQQGQTTGHKMYVPSDIAERQDQFPAGKQVSRNDRIHWHGGAFRVANPQFDEISNVVRFDIREDGRDLIHESDIVEGVELEEPDRGGFGGF